jgi:hypothetical protein
MYQTILGGRISLPDRAENERYVMATRATLGAEAFAAAWAEGETMTLEQAIAFVLEEDQA